MGGISDPVSTLPVSTCRGGVGGYSEVVTIVVTLLLLGVVLLMLETVLPGMIAGILGAVCLAAGVVRGFLVFGPQTGSYILLGVALGLIVGTALWLKYFPETPFARVFISERTVGDLKADKPELVGQTGTALTNLRPSGMAVIGGHRVDVVTEGGMIERGAEVKVVGTEGLRVVVRALAPVSASLAETN